jgi:hypothetical protein
VVANDGEEWLDVVVTDNVGELNGSVARPISSTPLLRLSNGDADVPSVGCLPASANRHMRDVVVAGGGQE